MATARTTTRKKATTKKKETTKVVSAKVVYVQDASDEAAAVRITDNGTGTFDITRVTDHYHYYPGFENVVQWEPCDDSISLTLADLKAAVEALDA